jgi:hypothetical protein
VNNACNRLIARTLFLAVVEASQKLIGNYQKMFLPGRQMTDHLIDINSEFYQKVQDRLDYYILFTDNAKAFDSIHHDFILSALRKQGFPAWFVNAVTNLITDVRVFPALAPDFGIDIKRGVKQGCPLSPLLFILCYDILEFKLSPLKSIRVKAAADDLAIGADFLEDAIRTFPVIDEYTHASGLGINRDKTVIISAKDHSSKKFEPNHRLIESSTWPLVKFVDSHKYLGILIGRKIQVEDIFAAPAEKAAARARRFSYAISRMGTQKRIITFNTFITPIFSFVQQFYIMPSSVYREYRSIMHRSITPFRGSGWPYSQLCAPTSHFGFKQPLRDPWVFNMLVFLRKVNFNLISSELDLPWNLDGSHRDNDKNTTSSNWDSPIFTVHANLQLMEFLGPNFLGWDGFSPLPCLEDKDLRRLVNQSLILSYNDCCSAYYTNNLGADHTRHLLGRLAKWGSSDIHCLLSHFSRTPKIPAFLVSHFIKLVCGADNLDGGRRRKFDPDSSVHRSKSTENPWPCYLCDQGSATSPGDCARHLFTVCNRVKAAWEGAMSHHRGPHDPGWVVHFQSSSPIFIPAFQPAPREAGYNRIAFIMSFSWATLKAIDQIRAGRSSTNADSRIVSLTISLRNIWAPAKKRRGKDSG